MWHTVVAAFLAALVAGFIYSYSTYSNALQAAFDLSEAEKETIGLAPILCNLITVTNGLLMDRVGIPACTVLGGVILAVAYTLYGPAQGRLGWAMRRGWGNRWLSRPGSVRISSPALRVVSAVFLRV